tara:strand:+ start:676 stop:978 length:303 start_codon:yes stop_codon:yes gene_type:complete
MMGCFTCKQSPPSGGFKQFKLKGEKMLTFKNWLVTRQGKFFQQQLVEGHKFMSDDELKKIYQIFKKHKFARLTGVSIGESWDLQNEDGSLGIPGLKELGL